MTKLVLVRHGKPENKAIGGSDFDRRLTDEGRKAIRASYPGVFGMLSPDDALELWVSPAVRAQQTADEVARAIEPNQREDHDSLYEQDEDRFLEELIVRLRHVEYPLIIIAVGHVPFMERMSADLTGIALPFSAGAACSIDLDDRLFRRATGPDDLFRDPMRTPGRLDWFVQGPVVVS